MRLAAPGRVVIALLSLAGAATIDPRSASAQSPFWAGVAPGRYPIGFRVVDTSDVTQSFPSAAGVTGPRPMRLYVWYPAARNSGMPVTAAMLAREAWFGGGVFRPQDTLAFMRTLIRIRSGVFSDSLLPDAEADRLLGSPFAARMNSPAAAGKFPVILLAPGQPITMPVSAEALASNGFIVIGAARRAHLSTESLEFTPNTEGLESESADMSFVLGVARGWRTAEPRHIGVLAYSSSGLSTLAFCFRSGAVEAAAVFEGWEGWKAGQPIVRGLPFYDPSGFRASYLLLEKDGSEPNPQFAKTSEFFDSIRFAPRWRVAFSGASHPDFASFAVALPRTSEELKRNFRRANEYLIAFFRAQLTDSRASDWLPAREPGVTATAYPVLNGQPSRESFYHLAETDPSAALRVVRGLPPGVEPPFTESSLMRLAVIATLRRPLDGATVYEIVTVGYPRSVRAAAGRSDALWTAGRRDDSRAAARQAVQLIEQDQTPPDAQRVALRSRLVERVNASPH